VSAWTFGRREAADGTETLAFRHSSRRYRDGTITEAVELDILLDGEIVGRTVLDLGHDEGRDGVADLAVSARIVGFGPMGPERARTLGFDTDG